MISWVELRGEHREVGRQLGRWWVARIKKDTNPRARERYREDLVSSWDDRMAPLLWRAAERHPELVAEMEGISEGVNEAGWKTSMPEVFALCLAETGPACSSFVAPRTGGFVVGHNEEWDGRVPLCYAKVELRTEDGTRRFSSISYPFQLFGSCAGNNATLAFQGNSIGAGPADLAWLQASWRARTPKTFFTRNLLEAQSIAAAVRLFSSEHATIPTHHFVVAASEAISLEVRPVARGEPERQVKTRAVRRLWFAHMNHFRLRSGPDVRWSDTKSNLNESVQRLEKLEGLLSKGTPSTPEEVLSVLLAQRKGWTRYTLASLCFEVRRDGVTCSGLDYLASEPRVLAPAGQAVTGARRSG